jgi:hypothetical protein
MRSITRRSLLYGIAAMGATAQKLTSAVTAVDHLLIGVNDLDRGVDWVEQRTGIRALYGGSHPGAGTRNALLSLGGGRYLEIIAPDPSQAEFNFHIALPALHEPRMVNFAIKTTAIEDAASRIRRSGYQVSGPAAGARVLPSGETLRWRTLRVINRLASGDIWPVPFLIEWAPDAPHPSQTSPGGCKLQALELEHPTPSELKAVLKTLGIEAKVSHATSPRIIAAITTPKGHIELS